MAYIDRCRGQCLAVFWVEFTRYTPMDWRVGRLCRYSLVEHFGAAKMFMRSQRTIKEWASLISALLGVLGIKSC